MRYEVMGVPWSTRLGEVISSFHIERVTNVRVFADSRSFTVCEVCFKHPGGRTIPMFLVGKEYFAGSLGTSTGTSGPESSVTCRLTGTRT